MLQRYGITAQVQCQRYWEVWHDGDSADAERIKASLQRSPFVLEDTSATVQWQWTPAQNTVAVLVRPLTDYVGKYAVRQWQQNEQLTIIQNCLQGIIWQLTLPGSTAAERLRQAGQILQTYLLYNPYNEECLMI